jgi:hypothetical protein
VTAEQERVETSPLRLGVVISLTTLGFAGVAGLIAVLDADQEVSAVGIGLGIALAVFLVGGTIACGLACLIRRRVELAALAGIVAAGVAIDLLVVAIWKEIGNETYGKIVGVSFAWTLYALVILGLTLAVARIEIRRLGRSTQVLYGCSVGATVFAGLVTTWLIATSGDVSATGPVETAGVTDDGLLRALGAALVLVATLWFAALAASRIDRHEHDVESPPAPAL